ncbi:MAG: hypothetical protein ACJ789_16200 [Thermomicrobiales bacterium]
MTSTQTAPPRPAEICQQLIQAMEGAEGRRKRRKRDTTPDSIGMEIKRDLLERAAAADPDIGDFEAWLAEQCLAAGTSAGPTRAMALEILAEWQVAMASEGFLAWLEEGAPSDDRRPGTDMGLDPR